MRNTNSVSVLRGCAAAIALVVVLLGTGRTAHADIIDEWSTVTIPAPPALKPVTLDGPTTALLMIDFLPSNCGASPRCVAMLPRVRTLLDAARAAHALVIYTEYPPNNASVILPPVAPLGGEPNVIALADKFINTNLDQILKDKGIKTVVTVGANANAGVLYTASDAAMRGYAVVVPVDAMAGTTPYAEVVAATTLATASTIAARITLTRTSTVKF